VFAYGCLRILSLDRNAVPTLLERVVVYREQALESRLRNAARPFRSRERDCIFDRELRLNLSGISNSSFFGRVLRAPLELIPDSMQLRIVQAPLKRTALDVWAQAIMAAGWGSYEFDKQRQIAAAVQGGMVCLDMGANVAFLHACLF
jgi:hypothetical protein